jgi:membrane fusion protein, multidrug efflux system
MKTNAMWTVLLAASVAACASKGDGAATSNTAVASEPVIRVTTTEVSGGSFPVMMPLTGTLRGDAEADVAAGTNGRLIKVTVVRGAKVKKGDTLAIVDTRQAQISAAEASVSAKLAQEQVTTATRECERTQALFDKGAIAKAEYDKLSDQCRTSALSAQAANYRAAQAGQVVSDGVIRAPFDGLVAEKFVEQGEFVRADSRIATVVTPNSLRLEFAIPEQLVGQVKNGDEVSFRVPSQPGKQFRAKVSRLGIAIREATRDLPIEAYVEPSDKQLAPGQLLPGMFAELALSTGVQATNAVSQAAVVTRSGKQYVYVAEKDRATLRAVTTIGQLGDQVGVSRGLQKGERVIVSPPAGLSNGARIGF